MALDKLTIINNALIATGNEPVNVADDGSDEWRVGSSAFDRYLPVVMASKQWKFKTEVAELVRIGQSSYPAYTDIYEKPADCLRIENVWDTNMASNITPVAPYGMLREQTRVPQLDYRIIGNQIHTNAPNGVSCLYTQLPADGDPATVGFIESLTLEIEAALVRGLNEDPEGGMTLKGAARGARDEAKFQEDAQEPRRAIFRSAMVERRRTRRGR